MITKLKLFFAKLRLKRFDRRVNQEIFQKIFSHLNGEANHGYPFDSDEEFEKRCLYAELDAKLHVELIEKRAARMPAAYGKAFRYIAYRDLNERMKMYLEIAERRIQPETCDPRLVATQAA
jgi:hypothetical protein